MIALMSSVCGVPVGGEGFTYWRTCNTTMNALEDTMASYNDLMLPLDEAGSMQGAGNTEQRALALHNMIFRFSLGTVKGRRGEPPAAMSRITPVISSNRSLPSVLGPTHAAEAEVLTDRLLNIPFLDEREFGAFDYLPSGFETMTAFVGALKRSAAENYGHAIIRYLNYLVYHKYKDPARIRKFVAGTIVEFIQRSGADPNNGSQKRVAEAFGIVAAGGLLAKRAGILPKNYRPFEAALECHGLHRDHGRMSRTFDDRLKSLLRDPKTIDLDAISPADLTDKMLIESRCYLRTGRSGDRYLLVPKKFRDRLLPGWNLIRHDSDVELRHVKHQQRNAKVELFGNGIQRTCYRFDITELED